MLQTRQCYAACGRRSSVEGAAATLNGYAAGDLDDRAVDIARLVGREPGVGIGDLFGPPETAHGYLFLDRPQPFLRYRVEDRRGDETRTDRVGADALAAKLTRPGLDHADDAELGRGVVGLPEVAVQTDDRRRVEDAARILPQHDINDRLGAV